MLTKNIWQSRGLYNGSLGTVRGLVYHGEASTLGPPYCILVEFDEYRGPSAATNSNCCIMPIVPETAPFDPGCGHSGSRVQFPLVLGRAMTIHKSQGLTLNKAVVGVGDSENAIGLTYVGCSRVKSWQNLAFHHSFPWSQMEKINNHPGLVKIKAELLRLSNLQGDHQHQGA